MWSNEMYSIIVPTEIMFDPLWREGREGKGREGKGREGKGREGGEGERESSVVQ